MTPHVEWKAATGQRANPNLIDAKKYKELVDAHVMFKDMDADPYLKSAGISGDWPCGRGCYQSADGGFIIWFGEEDQLRIMCMGKGYVLNEIFDRLHTALDLVESIEGIEFATSKKYGYVTSCPSNLGTGMRASVHLKIPNLTKGGNETKAKVAAKPLGLSVRGTGGEHTPIGADGTVDISPSSRLFVSEAEIVTKLYTGIKLLLEKEAAAAAADAKSGVMANAEKSIKPAKPSVNDDTKSPSPLKRSSSTSKPTPKKQEAKLTSEVSRTATRAKLPKGVSPGPDLIVGASASKDLIKYMAVFAPLAERTDAGAKLRTKGFRLADPNGNGLCSLAEIEGFVQKSLITAHPGEDGLKLFDSFRPCYIRTYNDAKDYKTDTGNVIEGTKKSTADDFVSKGEFRLLCSYLVIYGVMFDAFSKIDGGGAGRDANDDKRIEMAEFIKGYKGVTEYGFVALSSLKNDRIAKAAFQKMDGNGGGIVLLDEWCDFIKDAEIEAGTGTGFLLAEDEEGGVGVPDAEKPVAAAAKVLSKEAKKSASFSGAEPVAKRAETSKSYGAAASPSLRRSASKSSQDASGQRGPSRGRQEDPPQEMAKQETMSTVKPPPKTAVVATRIPNLEEAKKQFRAVEGGVMDNGTKEILEQDFKALINSLLGGVPHFKSSMPSDKDLVMAFKFADENKSGTVDENEFLNLYQLILSGKVSGIGKTSIFGTSSGVKKQLAAANASYKAIGAIGQLLSADEIKDLTRLFRDTVGSGAKDLSKDQFKKLILDIVVKESGPSLPAPTNAELELAFSQVAKTKKRAVNEPEFLVAAGTSMKTARDSKKSLKKDSVTARNQKAMDKIKSQRSAVEEDPAAVEKETIFEKPDLSSVETTKSLLTEQDRSNLKQRFDSMSKPAPNSGKDGKRSVLALPQFKKIATEVLAAETFGKVPMPTEADLGEAFTVADTNESGFLDFDEFVTVMSAYLGQYRSVQDKERKRRVAERKAAEAAKSAAEAGAADESAPPDVQAQAASKPKKSIFGFGMSASKKDFGFDFKPGKSVTQDYTDFASVFQPLCADTPEGTKMREEGFLLADPNNNGLCSLAELEAFVLNSLLAKFPNTGKGKDLKTPGKDLFTSFRPCYVRAFADAKDFEADSGAKIKGTKKATADDFVSKKEFRLFCAYLLIYGAMFDAFAKIDGGGAGRGKNDDKRLVVDEWLLGYKGVLDQGFVALKSITSLKEAKDAFASMDDNGGGIVLLDEWCEFLKKAEVEAGTSIGKLLDLDEEGGVGRNYKLAGKAKVTAKGPKRAQSLKEPPRKSTPATDGPRKSVSGNDGPQKKSTSMSVSSTKKWPSGVFGMMEAKKQFRAACTKAGAKEANLATFVELMKSLIENSSDSKIEASDKDLTAAFKLADEDKSGAVDEAEFVKLYELALAGKVTGLGKTGLFGVSSSTKQKLAEAREALKDKSTKPAGPGNQASSSSISISNSSSSRRGKSQSSDDPVSFPKSKGGKALGTSI